MKLVVGLGNPGREYVGTRHNVGWEAVDRVAERLGWIGGGPGAFETFARGKFEGLTVDGNANGEKVLLLKPMTFMNLSGRSVQSAMAFYQLSPADILVVLDDVALPCGKIRIRAGGSSGGHNGLKDIERALATSQYPRLRIGVDAPPPRVPQRDYVLGKFTAEQRKVIDEALGRAAGAVATWIDKGVTAAMNQFNADEDEKKESPQRRGERGDGAEKKENE
jgi:PTH1 family peptidyl-tRNA hydrolase